MSASNKWAADNITEVATPKISVITKISKWDKYEYVEMDNMKFIKGSSPNNKNSELFEFQTINDIGVLIDLLVLKNQIQAQYTNNEKEIEKRITTSDTENIIKFCKRWGLPRWGLPPIYNYCINEQQHTIAIDEKKILQELINNEKMPKDEFVEKLFFVINSISRNADITETTILREVVPFATENYLHISSFIRALHWLKSDFLRIVAAHNLEDDVNIKPLLIDNDYERIKSMHEHSSFDMFMPCQNPFVTYWNGKRKGLFLNCENLIHLSVYYLCAIHQTGKCFGGYIKICKSCGNPFVTTNANRKYCGTSDMYGCTRQAYCNKKTRQKKKALLP